MNLPHEYSLSGEAFIVNVFNLTYPAPHGKKNFQIGHQSLMNGL